jgi:GGDEF domain-containing protein
VRTLLKRRTQIIDAMDQAYADKKIACPVTVSIGMEFFAKTDNTYDQAYKKADRALYKAKDAPANVVLNFTNNSIEIVFNNFIEKINSSDF